MKKTFPLLLALLLATMGLFAQLQFVPGSVDFGQRAITSTTNLDVVLTSQINQQVTLSGLTAPFTATPASFAIAIGESKTITITFIPQAGGSFTGTLTATGGIWGTVQMQVTGYAVPAIVSFSQQSLDFGSVIMTGHLQQMVTVQSDIAQQVTLSGPDVPFASNPATINLQPNIPAQVFISFDPTTPGDFYGSLVATGALSGTAILYVSGTATPASIFSFPQSCIFNPLFSGATETIEVIITSDINQVVTVTGLSDVFTLNPTELTLTSGDPETVFVTFSPVNPGVFNQTLQLSGDLWGTLDVPVYGECIDPQISVSPSQLDFGTIPLLSSTTQYVTVYNSGNGVLECELTNNNPHFTVSPGLLNIWQGNSQGVAITFVPNFVPVEYDTLLITTNDPDTPIVKIPLQGQGMSQVSGEACGTWYKANSPYYFTGSVTVPYGCTLNIEPGVYVNGNGANFSIHGK